MLIYYTVILKCWIILMTENAHSMQHVKRRNSLVEYNCNYIKIETRTYWKGTHEDCKELLWDVKSGYLLYIHVFTHTHFLELYPERIQKQWHPVTMSTPGTQILVSKYHNPLKIIRAPWRLILGLEQGKYKMNLKYLVAPESKEVLKEWSGTSQKDTSQL